MSMNNSHQTANSLNNFRDNKGVKKSKKDKGYREKYQLDPRLSNRYAGWVTNPTVQPDEKTEMGVPVPSQINTEFSKEYQEENKL